MNTLAKGIANWVERTMASEIASLAGEKSECRAVFCGPPMHLLVQVFDALAGDRPLLEATKSDGQAIRYPVILQVDVVPPGALQGSATQSGYLPFHGLASVRNDRSGVFLALIAPGAQASDTHESTRTTIGLAPAVNEGGAAISTWWIDPFIQTLVKSALPDSTDDEVEKARELIREAMVAADAADQHDVARVSAWRVIEKLWALKDQANSLDEMVSLAAGYPPSGDGSFDAKAKLSVLSAIVERIESENFGGLSASVLAKARDDEEKEIIKECLGDMRNRCDVVTAVRRCAPYAYATESVSDVPAWWSSLTVSRWNELLDENDTPEPDGELTIECTNALLSHLKGLVPVVKAPVHLRLRTSEEEFGEADPCETGSRGLERGD